MICPGCRAELSLDTVGGAELRACSACSAVVLQRAHVKLLRGVDRSLHPALTDRPTGEGNATSRGRACPTCGKTMLSHAFAGGNTRSESCDACEWVFFERGELAAVLDEARVGIAMDEKTRARLHAHSAMSTWERVNASQLAGVGAVVMGLVIFVQLTRRGHVAVPIAAAIALAVFAYFRRRAEKGEAAATHELRQVMQKEEHRLAHAARDPSTAPGTRSASRARPSATPCPFCGAQLPAGTTHCTACDSDFG